MCCKNASERRVIELERKAKKLALNGKDLSQDEERELHNLRIRCFGAKRALRK
jgi:hypothetical protein